MAKLVFVHGWGFGPSFWQDVIVNLSDMETQCLDLGFFGPAQTDIDGDDLVFVTHSMGLPWVLKHVQTDYNGLIAINGFTKFCSADDWSQGIDPRVLSRMIRQFQKNPQQVWTDFMIKCGLKNPICPESVNEEALLKGLQNLQGWDVRQEYAQLNSPILTIAAKEDEIVPNGLSLDCFGQELVWVDPANHLLPLHHSVLISAHIRSFVEKLT
jgi:pimeloyl-[acyl-carrier protein] methyl ester esterase